MAEGQVPTVIISGANGFLGSALVDHFTRKKWKVIGLVRKPGDYKQRPGLRYAAYDLEEPFDETVFEGATYLVHTAYVKKDSKHPNAIDTNVDAAKYLVGLSRRYGLSKNIFISSMSAHTQAESAYGKQKLAIEKLFNSKTDLSLRPGLIIGNGGIVKQMSDFMRSYHLVPIIDNGRQPVQVVAIYDLVKAIDKGLSSTINGLLTIANPKIYSYRQFYTLLKKRLHIAVIFVPVPFFVLYGAMRIVATLRIPLSINEDNLLGLKKLTSVNTNKDLSLLGVNLDDLETILSKTDL